MPPNTAPKAPKGKTIRQIVGTYTKDDGSSSARNLLTVDQLQAPGSVLALDVTDKTPSEVQAVTVAFKEYQQGLAEHMRQYPTMDAFLKERGFTVAVKSFKIAGLLKGGEPKVTEIE